jgi:O-methyltransferase
MAACLSRALFPETEPELSTLESTKYLDLLKATLCASLYDESAWRIVEGPMQQHVQTYGLYQRLMAKSKFAVVRSLRKRGLALVRLRPYDEVARQNGRDWPMFGYTMTGRRRLDALERCVNDVIDRNVPGDFIETGVWRGGSAILMKAILRSRGITDRLVWCADSFEGMPVPKQADQDTYADYSDRSYLAVSVEQVRHNFARFDLLDDQVRFLKGWFCDTLPTAPVKQLAILRLDGDLYESTMDALVHLYDKLSPGGHVIIDDYGSWRGCRSAVDKFRKDTAITTPMERIDSDAVRWQK